MKLIKKLINNFLFFSINDLYRSYKGNEVVLFAAKYINFL